MRQIKMYFWGVLSLFFTNPSFGTSIHITNTIDTKCGCFNINMLSSQNEEHKSCPFDNTFLGDDVSDGSKSGNANDDFTTTIEKVLRGTNDNEEIDVSGEIKQFKEKRELLCKNKSWHILKQGKERLDGTIDRFSDMYSDRDLKDSRFIGLENKGVLVGTCNIKGKELFLGRREEKRMLGILKKVDKKEAGQLIGYFNMNDKGEVKNAGIAFSPSDKEVGFSIKFGPEKEDRVLFSIPITNEIKNVYKEINRNTNFFKSLKNPEKVKIKVGSMFEDRQRDFDKEEFLAFCDKNHLPLKSITPSQFSSIIKSDIFKKIIDDSTKKYKVYDEAFSFPIYLNGEKRNGLLFFVAEGENDFNLCFCLQTSANDICEFVPLLIISFFNGNVVGQSYLLFDYKNYSNFCRINCSKLDTSFCCNFSLPNGKEIIIGENFDEDKVYIASPLNGNKIKHGKEQGHSLRRLIRSSDSRLECSKENTDFSLMLSSSSQKGLRLEIPCLKNGPVFNFVFLHSGYIFYLEDHIKKGDKEINILNNLLFVCKNLVLLMEENCVNKDILNVKILEGKKKIEANFYYPKQVRDVDSICDFIKQIIKAAFFVGGSELPFIVSMEAFKERNWNKNVDNETGAFLTDVFSNSNVETDSIKEDEKELNTNNNINEEENINKEKKEKEIDVVPAQKNVNNKIEYKTKLNRNKHERKKRKREEKKLDSIESTNKISNGLKKGENLDFKQGEEVTIEYFLEGKDGKKEKGEIKYKIEDEEKKFFGEKRRIVILSKEKKVPHNFTYKGSVSEILKSGDKNYPKIHELLTRALFNLSCAKILKDSSIKMSKINNVQIRNMAVLEVYIAHNTETEIGNQVRLLVAYDKAKKTFYALDSLCHYDK